MHEKPCLIPIILTTPKRFLCCSDFLSVRRRFYVWCLFRYFCGFFRCLGNVVFRDYSNSLVYSHLFYCDVSPNEEEDPFGRIFVILSCIRTKGEFVIMKKVVKAQPPSASPIDVSVTVPRRLFFCKSFLFVCWILQLNGVLLSFVPHRFIFPCLWKSMLYGYDLSWVTPFIVEGSYIICDTIVPFRAAMGLWDIACFIVFHHQTQSNQVCYFQVKSIKARPSLPTPHNRRWFFLVCF